MSHYKLRAHHGLCLHFFVGKGYSKAFVQNMTEIKNTLAQNPTIQLTDGADAVCAACHHRVGVKGCESQEKVTRYDAVVFAMTNCKAGDVLRWADFYDTVQQHILAEHALYQVCPDCEWYAICSKA